MMDASTKTPASRSAAPQQPSSASGLRSTVQTALFAALIAVGAYIAIPIPFSPVPLVLQNMLVLLAGLLLGPRRAAAAVMLYLALGSLGLPIFAGGAAGPATFVGPTGGYLVAYLPAALLTAAIAQRCQSTAAVMLGTAIGAGLILALGALWLATVAGLSWYGAAVTGILPFIPGDVLKVLAAVALRRRLLPLFREDR